MNGPSDHPSVRAELLGRLLDEHGPALALYASQWTDAADDCVQEALLELARQSSVPENSVAWLYRVVKHRALNAARGARRRREREARVAQRRLLDDDTKAFDRWDAQAVTEALHQLGENQRELIVMRIWGRLTFDQIAAALSISRSTAHRVYHQALLQLRERLEPPCSTGTKHTDTTTDQSCPRS
ncbi:MAG: sigma-70 family RNA polymerase sigma factor [Pirellulales bacterium]